MLALSHYKCKFTLLEEGEATCVSLEESISCVSAAPAVGNYPRARRSDISSARLMAAAAAENRKFPSCGKKFYCFRSGNTSRKRRRH